MAKEPKTVVKDPKEQDEPDLLGQTDGTEETQEGEKPQGNEEEAAAILQKQIDDLTRAAATERERANQIALEREKAIQQAREREAQVLQARQEAGQSKYDAIASAIAAATAEAESAQRDIEAAINAGDIKTQADAYRRLARAESNLSNLENGKLALEESIKRQPQTLPQQDSVAQLNLPDTAKAWLRSHPEYMQDHRKNAKIQSLHWDVLDEGHAPFSPEYFVSLEQHLGLRQQIQQTQQTQQVQQGGGIVSAPVSREIPTGGGQRPGSIQLSPDQRQAAKIAGVTEKVYAENLKKLNEMKANGQYQAGGN